MTERDAMALLMEANPVRAEDLSRLDAGVVEKILARRRPSRRVVLIAAISLAVLAAALIATFATGGRTSSPSTGPMENDLFSPTVARPLPGKEVTLADASAELGQPIVLPNTSLVRPSEAGHVWVAGGPPNLTAAVNFPSAGVFVEYTAPPPSQDPRATYERIAQENPRSFETIDLEGATALTVKQNTDDTGHNFGGVVFVLHGLEIRVFGHYDTAILLTVAESIVRQERAPTTGTLGIGSPPTIEHPLPFGGELVSLPAAGLAFGARIVQPDTGVVSPSDAGSVWTMRRPDLNVVAVTYPAANTWVTYSWPLSYDGGYDDRLLRYHTTGNSSTHTVLLDGVPAQGVFHSWKKFGWSGFYPSIHFAAGGVDIRVLGRQKKSTLLAIARSIVDRSEQPPAGRLGDVAGVQVYPYLGHGREISLPMASTTLGAPVVLPDSPLAPAGGAQAWAEGTCPHPAAKPATTEVCAIWISYPGSRLSVGYIRPPAYLGTGKEWRLQARMLGGRSSAVRLDGVPALSIHRDPAAGYPGRVELDLGGTRVVVAGDYSPARLQEVARSIVARSG